MREVVLHGRLKKQFGGPFRLDVATAGEALRLLNVNFDGFGKAMSEGSYQVVCGDLKTGVSIDLDGINSYQLGKASIHFLPVIEGSKDGGSTIKAVAGIALMGTAVFLSGGVLAAPIGALGLTYGNLAAVGLAMTLTGISQAHAKSADEEKKQSYTINGPGNAYEQGNPVPIVYGEVMTGSVLISGGIDVEDIA